MQVLSHFTFDSLPEYVSFCKHMAAFNLHKSHTEETKAPVADANAKTTGPKETTKTETTKTEAKKPEAKTETKSDKKEANVPPIGERLDNEPTYENVKTAILAVAQKYKSKAKAFEILKGYDIEKVTPDIPEKHFEGIIADCQKALDAEE